MRVPVLVILISVLTSVFFVGSIHTNRSFAREVDFDSISITPWYTHLLRDEAIAPEALHYAFEGMEKLKEMGQLSNDSVLTLIDFSKPSNEERFYLIDIVNGKLIQKSLVAHGKNSGVVYANDFSNRIYSNKSSLGLFVTSESYFGKHGYSLRIKGMNSDLNSNAYQRAVVIHGANYVSAQYLRDNGRLGRSFGCPALPYTISSEVIDIIKGGTCLYIYHPSISIKS